MNNPITFFNVNLNFDLGTLTDLTPENTLPYRSFNIRKVCFMRRDGTYLSTCAEVQTSLSFQHDLLNDPDPISDTDVIMARCPENYNTIPNDNRPDADNFNDYREFFDTRNYPNNFLYLNNSIIAENELYKITNVTKGELEGTTCNVYVGDNILEGDPNTGGKKYSKKRKQSKRKKQRRQSKRRKRSKRSKY
jgi:hypothetical protein